MSSNTSEWRNEIELPDGNYRVYRVWPVFNYFCPVSYIGFIKIPSMSCIQPFLLLDCKNLAVKAIFKISAIALEIFLRNSKRSLASPWLHKRNMFNVF